jgi:3-phenylpropionate/cinnamic acid dioxygenase small subunit
VSEAVRDIEALVYLYAERMDEGDFSGVAALFADAEYRAAGGPALRGAAALQTTLESMVRRYDGKPSTKHVTTNLVVEIDAAGTRATARSYFTVLQALPNFPLQVVVAGRYHDRFALRDGRWGFAEREVWMDLVGDLSRHLNHFARSK